MTNISEVAQLTIPESLKFSVPKKGPSGTRKVFRGNSVSSTYSTSTDKIVRFFFPNTQVLDFRRGAITFNLQITNSNGSYARLSQGIWSIFNRVRLSTGMELEDIREYNLLHSLIWETFRDDDAGDNVGPVYGYTSQAERNILGATTTGYQMPMLCGFFLSGAVPLSLFQEQLKLELYLEDTDRCVETDSNTTPIITLTNIYFHYEVLEMAPGVEMNIRNMAKASGVCYPFRSFTYYTQSLTSSVTNNVIPHSSAGIDAFISVMRNYSNLASRTTNDKFITWLPNNTLQHQLKLNNEYYPLEPTSCTDPQSYIEMLRWISKWKLGGVYNRPTSISYEAYNLNRFIIIKSVEMYPGEGLVNEVSTDMSGQYVYLLLWMSSAPPSNTNLDTFVQSFKCIKFMDKKLILM